MVKKLIWLAVVLGVVVMALGVLLWRQSRLSNRADPIFTSERFNSETVITGPQRKEWEGGPGLLYVISPIKLESIKRNRLAGTVSLIWSAKIAIGDQLVEKTFILETSDPPPVLRLDQSLSQLLIPGNYYGLSFLRLDAARPIAKEWLKERFCREESKCLEYIDQRYPTWLSEAGQGFVSQVTVGSQAQLDLADLGLWVDLIDLRPDLYEQLNNQP
ncbi:MAG: hypothetical protein ACOYY3_20725 [Chloroflexota bacterium]